MLAAQTVHRHHKCIHHTTNQSVRQILTLCHNSTHLPSPLHQPHHRDLSSTPQHATPLRASPQPTREPCTASRNTNPPARPQPPPVETSRKRLSQNKDRSCTHCNHLANHQHRLHTSRNTVLHYTVQYIRDVRVAAGGRNSAREPVTWRTTTPYRAVRHKETLLSPERGGAPVATAAWPFTACRVGCSGGRGCYQ